MPKRQLPFRIDRGYARLLLAVLGRAIQAGSRVDPVLREELSAFPTGFRFALRVLPDGPGLYMEQSQAGHFVLLGQPPSRVDLSINFKHLAHAVLLLSFQESTAKAFARGRMTLRGDVGHAVRIVRCFNRLEPLILPKLIALRAVKRYPDTPWLRRVADGARIYGSMVEDLLRGR